MEHKCPTCERTFEGISDYPLVYVAKFERLNIPSGVVLPDHSPEIYVGPNSKCGNERPPQEVLDFFKGHKRAENFEHEGYTWHRQGNWDSGSYYRSRKDANEFIVAQLAPYFDTLEGLVGKEVPRTEVLPKFGDVRYGHCRIPDTSYDLNLQELDGGWGRQMLEQEKLQVPDLKTTQPTRKLAFVITQSDGGSISVVHFLATVGGLAYEGRVRK